MHTAVSAGAVSLATDLTWQLGQMVLITDRAEAGDWVDSVLAMPGIDDDDRVVGVLATGALTDWITGRYEIGYDRALRIQQLMARPDPVWCASVGNVTGIHQLVRGDAVEAIALSREAVQFAATRGGEYARLQLSLHLWCGRRASDKLQEASSLRPVRESRVHTRQYS